MTNEVGTWFIGLKCRELTDSTNVLGQGLLQEIGLAVIQASSSMLHLCRSFPIEFPRNLCGILVVYVQGL